MMRTDFQHQIKIVICYLFYPCSWQLYGLPTAEEYLDGFAYTIRQREVRPNGIDNLSVEKALVLML